MEAQSIPLLARAADYGTRLALVADDGSLSYAALLEASAGAARVLLGDRADLEGTRVALLVPPSLAYAVATWGVWQAGGVAVPLCIQHPQPELRHVIEDAGVAKVVVHPSLEQRLEGLCSTLGVQQLSTQHLFRSPIPGPHSRERAEPAQTIGQNGLPRVPADRGALLIYTSGTTGKPKGVLTTHEILAAQMSAVAEAWAYRPTDRNLLVLPLHHLHGIMNVLWATLFAGGSCEMHPKFDAQRVWQRIAARDGLTLFMAVPTLYEKLTAAYRVAPEARRAALTAGCQALRLMVCGSAALPVPTLEAWRALSGHTLLERYGMTEIGMALGNPLTGERRPGHVGVPFPRVDVRIVDGQDRPVTAGEPGQLQVKGPGVFCGYWGRAEETARAFTDDGFFRTGDVAQCVDGVYRILGRASVDILKTGGYKVSALEIEACLREHNAVADCAVVGVPDVEWGQRVAAAVVLRPHCTLELQELRTFCKAQLAPYKAPSLLRVVADLPRNALGKVQKPAVARLFG